jgi:predicted transcriptional regulator
MATVRERAGDAALCIVTSDDGIVLGRLRRDAFDNADDDALTADVMEPGPTTVRYDESLPELVERMQKARVGSIIVTEPSGRLIGVVYRRDAEEALEQLQREHAHPLPRG